MDPVSGFGISLTDQSVSASPDDRVDLQFMRMADGTLQYRLWRHDFANQAINSLAAQNFFAPAGADQIELRMRHDNPLDRAVNAELQFWSGGVAMAGELHTLGPSFDLFHGEQFSRAQFFAFEAAPVPLPAAVWLFGAGLLGLAGVARRRRA